MFRGNRSPFALLTACLLLATSNWQALAQAVRADGVTVFEGARLITGDGSPPIENSSFVVENTQFTQVGKRGEVEAPPNASRIDLAGKTVMPAKVDLHGHIGFQHDVDGTMAKEYYTQENLVDHLERLAYYGFSAIVGIGDLVDRSDLHGGRTNWGDVPLRVRDEVIPGAALFKTAGPGMAWPGAGAQGHPSRADVMYFVTTPEEARTAVDDYVRIKPEFIKIWVDDRGGTKKTLTPPLYRAIAEEAHKYNVPVGVHNVTLADAKELLRAGVEGWLHVPVRGGEAVDDEVISVVKGRIARNDHPVMWITPSLHSMWMTASWVNTPAGRHPAWLDDPLLAATYPPQQIAQAFTENQKQNPASRAAAHEFELEGRNAMALRAAGMRIVMGTDTGQTRHWIGYYNHM